MKKYIAFMILPIITIVAVVVFYFTKGQKDGIKINTPFKTEYYLNEELDVSNGKIDYTKNGETVQIAVEPSMISNFKTDTIGARDLTLTYTDTESNKTYTLKIKYTVKDPYILDTTGTVVYKSDDAILGSSNGSTYAGIMLKGNKAIITDYSEGMQWDDSNAVTITKEFNEQTDKYEITSAVIPNSGGVYYKITDITESSFTLVCYSAGEPVTTTCRKA